MPNPGVVILTAGVTTSSSGANAVVAAITGTEIRVFAVIVSNNSGTANNVKWVSGSTDLEQAHQLATDGGGYTRDVNPPEYLFKTAKGEALNLNLSAAAAVAADVSYYTNE